MSIHTCLSSFASVSNRQTIPVTNTQLASLRSRFWKRQRDFVGSAIHFAYTLLSQPLSSHSFEGCDAKEQPSLTTMLRTSDASCARCFKNIVMHQRKHLDKESERGGRGKDGIRGGTEHPQHLLITPGELTAKEAIVIGGRKPAKSRQTQPKEGSDDENNRFNKQQKEGRRGRRRAERLRRKGRLNDLKQKTENSDTLEMLTEILMAPTVQTVAIKKQRDLSLVATRTIQKCFDGLLLKAIVDSELEKRGREASPELDTTSNTPKDIPPRSSPYSSPPPRWRRRHQSRGGEHDNSPNYQKPASIFAIEDDEVEGGRHQAAQTGRIAPRGGIGRGESDKDDDVKEPIPIVLQDIVSNILHVQTAQPDQTVLQRQKRKRERRQRNELHSIFKEEEELSTSEEERRRLRPSLQPSRPVRVSPHPAQRIQTAVYCRQIPFRTQTRQPLHFRFFSRVGPLSLSRSNAIASRGVHRQRQQPDAGRKVETAPSEYEKPKSKASAKLSKSPAKERKERKKPHETERSTVHQVVLQTFLNDLIDTVVQRCSADTSPHHRNTPFLTSSQPKLFWTRLFVHLSNHSAVFRLTAVKPFALTSIFNPHRFQSLFCGIPRVFVSLPSSMHLAASSLMSSGDVAAIIRARNNPSHRQTKPRKEKARRVRPHIQQSPETKGDGGRF
ncbi:hypothetical protein BLNAU_24830 [Blattamonas nauphoetae]|uniref:Uncharacterized protein n=1 Tax=Blattamonas nauphoetae TaxID=2049346 RepID=A0ABQ9WLC6_9EUKA|nr:hypothetical protein BLNAU_24830 [Blattamonas nauphoetae]